jgi:hypothetical protein
MVGGRRSGGSTAKKKLQANNRMKTVNSKQIPRMKVSY